VEDVFRQVVDEDRQQGKTAPINLTTSLQSSMGFVGGLRSVADDPVARAFKSIAMKVAVRSASASHTMVKRT